MIPRSPLPARSPCCVAGMPHFFLSAAFGSSSFLMLSHSKADPLDALLHQLLGYCMAAVAAAVLAQGAVQAVQASKKGSSQAYALSAAKSLALIMEVRHVLRVASTAGVGLCGSAS